MDVMRGDRAIGMGSAGYSLHKNWGEKGKMRFCLGLERTKIGKTLGPMRLSLSPGMEFLIDRGSGKTVLLCAGP